MSSLGRAVRSFFKEPETDWLGFLPMCVTLGVSAGLLYAEFDRRRREREHERIRDESARTARLEKIEHHLGELTRQLTRPAQTAPTSHLSAEDAQEIEDVSRYDPEELKLTLAYLEKRAELDKQVAAAAGTQQQQQAAATAPAGATTTAQPAPSPVNLCPPDCPDCSKPAGAGPLLEQIGDAGALAVASDVLATSNGVSP